MMEKTCKKGGGVHWDIVLLCLINCISGFFGNLSLYYCAVSAQI